MTRARTTRPRVLNWRAVGRLPARLCGMASESTQLLSMKYLFLRTPVSRELKFGD